MTPWARNATCWPAPEIVAGPASGTGAPAGLSPRLTSFRTPDVRSLTYTWGLPADSGSSVLEFERNATRLPSLEIDSPKTVDPNSAGTPLLEVLTWTSVGVLQREYRYRLCAPSS